MEFTKDKQMETDQLLKLVDETKVKLNDGLQVLHHFLDQNNIFYDAQETIEDLSTEIFELVNSELDIKHYSNRFRNLPVKDLIIIQNILKYLVGFTTILEEVERGEYNPDMREHFKALLRVNCFAFEVLKDREEVHSIAA